MLLYGHPFSSYTWKALIALYANEVDFEFRMVDADHPENVALVQSASPQGKFPVLADGDYMIFEATSIIEYVANRSSGPEMLMPARSRRGARRAHARPGVRQLRDEHHAGCGG